MVCNEGEKKSQRRGGCGYEVSDIKHAGMHIAFHNSNLHPCNVDGPILHRCATSDQHLLDQLL
jgi:hypothetical protein